MTRFERWLQTQPRGTLARIGRKIELSRASMSRIAAGKQKPSLDTAFAIERETAGAVTAAELSRVA